MNLVVQRTVTRKPSEFLSVAWSPDGMWIAAGGSDGCLWLFPFDGGELRLLKGHQGEVNSVAWSPDGRNVASGSEDKTVRVWEARTGKAERVLEGHSNFVLSVAWSPDGRSIASGSSDKTVRVWEAHTGKAERVLDGHSDWVRSVAWSPDGRNLASGSDDKTVRVWEARTGNADRVLEGHSHYVRSVAWSPDGRNLASGSDDKTVRVWEPHTGQAERVIEGHSLMVQSAAWSPDGRSLASGSWDGTVRVWEVRTGKAERVLEGHSLMVRSVAWSPDGRSLASGSSDITVRVWDSRTGKAERVLEGHSLAVASVAWSPDGGSLVCGSNDKTVRVWEARTGNAERVLEGHSDWVRSVVWSPDGRSLASGSSDKTVRVWEAHSGKAQHVLDRHSGAVLSVAWSPDGRSFASGSSDKTVRVWEAGTGKAERVLEGHSDWVRSVAWSPDGRNLASGSDDKTVRVWEAGTGKAERVLEGHSYWVLSVAWSPDGRSLASGSYDKTVRVWEAHTGKAERVLEGHSAAVADICWSDDGKLLASISLDCEVRVWRVEDGSLVSALPRLSWDYHPLGLRFASRGANLPDYWDGTILVDDWANAEAPVTTALSVSAKVVFIGESDVGKTTLAKRFETGGYVETGSTLGMETLALDPAKFDPDAKLTEGENHEIVLWDFGGQRHYQLFHQAFLHDTTLAVTLFDPTRDRTHFDAVREWNHRLTLRTKGTEVRKILVRNKTDLGGAVNQPEVDRLRADCEFGGYFEISAKLGQGVGVLGKEIHRLIGWGDLARISRTAGMQSVYDRIAELRDGGKVVVYERDVVAELGEQVEPGDFNSAVGHLAQQGRLVDVRLSETGDRVLVLRIDVLEKYAGSLVLAAQAHPRGVPVLEERAIAGMKEFPGMKQDERAKREEERAVLDAVVELFVGHGLCLRHAGLLVFPSEFPPASTEELAQLPHRKPIYYDFTGPIDNIYASLVADLAVSREFGSVRLWRNRAEYEETGRGVFGVYLREVRRGYGHLDVYFSDDAETTRRDLFVSYVDRHLRDNGVTISEKLGIKCVCGQELVEDWFRNALQRGESDLRCPQCGTQYPVFGGAEAAKAAPELQERLHALKVEVERGKKQAAEESKRAVGRARETAGDGPIRLLHLSDLHLDGTRGIWTLLNPLLADLRELKAERLDYLVVSGDFADKCSLAGFDRAEEFIQELLRQSGLNADRLILTPGNHDLDQKLKVYDFEESKPAGRSENEFIHVEEQDGYLVRNPVEYPKRFERFRKLYHNLLQREYPLAHEEQGVVIYYGDPGIEFLTLNTAWDIDKRSERISIHREALNRALLESAKNPARLRIVVWHHAVTADRRIANPEQLGNLTKAGFRVCLHGDIHEESTDVVNPRGRRLHVIGTGSFGAHGAGLPEATPRLYSLLEIDHDFDKVRVRMRRQRRADGEFEPYAVFGTTKNTRRDWYDIKLTAPSVR